MVPPLSREGRVKPDGGEITCCFLSQLLARGLRDTHGVAEQIEYTVRWRGQVVRGPPGELGHTEPRRVHHQDRRRGLDGRGTVHLRSADEKQTADHVCPHHRSG